MAVTYPLTGGIPLGRLTQEYTDALSHRSGWTAMTRIGVPLKKANYHQLRRRKEESRKARQQEKLDRRQARSANLSDSAQGGSPETPVLPDASTEPSSL